MLQQVTKNTEHKSAHAPGEPFKGRTLAHLAYPQEGLEYTGAKEEVKPGMWFESERDNIGLYRYDYSISRIGIREILRPRQKPALPPPDSPYWVQNIFGIDSFLSWEDKPRSINVRAVDDPHGYVWHPDGRSWLDRVLSKAYDLRTLHIAPKGYFDGNETANIANKEE